MKFEVGDSVKMIGWRKGYGKTARDQQFVDKIGTVVKVITSAYDYEVEFPFEKNTFWYEDELEKYEQE